MLHCVNKYRHISDCKVTLYTQIFHARSNEAAVTCVGGVQYRFQSRPIHSITGWWTRTHLPHEPLSWRSYENSQKSIDKSELYDSLWNILHVWTCSTWGLVRISHMLRQLSRWDRLESTASGRDWLLWRTMRRSLTTYSPSYYKLSVS